MFLCCGLNQLRDECVFFIAWFNFTLAKCEVNQILKTVARKLVTKLIFFVLFFADIGIDSKEICFVSQMGRAEFASPH